MNQIAAAFLAACRAEIEAPKPGNVHIFAGGHDMEAEHFLRSAEAAAEPLTKAGASVGDRVLRAIEASMQAAGTNTNLGIVLLCAPLAKAVETLISPPPRGEGQGWEASQRVRRERVFVGSLPLATPTLSPSPQGGGKSYELRQVLWATLESLDVNDAIRVFAAIRLANPGGMGKAKTVT